MKVAKTYGYTVSFDTVGQFFAKKESEVGGCSQFAMFNRSGHVDDSSIITSNESQNDMAFKLISCIDYPFFEEFDFSDGVIVDSIFDHCKEIFRKEALWKKEMSAVGFQLDLKEIWDILEIRQKCKTFDKLQRVISSESGARVFNRIGTNRIACDLDIPITTKETSEVVDELEPFEELCINSTHGAFEGWGIPNPEDLKCNKSSCW